LLRHRVGVALADRTGEGLVGMVVIAEQVGAVEDAELRDLLRHLEGGHGAHLEVAALERGHFGALAEELASRIDLHVELRRGLFQLALELLQRAAEEIRRRRRGREAQHRLLRPRARRGERERHYPDQLSHLSSRVMPPAAWLRRPPAI